MPIEVKNGVGPTAIQANFVAGQSQSRLAEERRQAEIAEQERFTKERDKAHFQNQTDQANDAQARRWEDEERTFSTQQRRKREKLEAAKENIQSAKYLTDEQKMEAMSQVDAEIAGITPFVRQKKPSPYPKGQGIGETWESPDGMMHLGRDKDGKIYKIGSTGKPTHQDKIKGWDIAVKSSTNSETGQVDWEVAKKRYAEMGFGEKGGDSTGGGEPWAGYGDAEIAKAEEEQAAWTAKNGNDAEIAKAEEEQAAWTAKNNGEAGTASPSASPIKAGDVVIGAIGGEVSEEWATANPLAAEKLARIENPSRKDLKEAGLPRQPGGDRKKAAEKLREIVKTPKFRMAAAIKRAKADLRKRLKREPSKNEVIERASELIVHD